MYLEVQYKQIIVANKGLNMSRGKLSAQVSHGSMAFMSWMIRNNVVACGTTTYYAQFLIDKSLFENWINGSFTKVVLSVDDEQGLVDVVQRAREQGMVEGEDYFCIRDNCMTELTPDETGTRWTVIGFKPMSSDVIDSVTKNLKLYK